MVENISAVTFEVAPVTPAHTSQPGTPTVYDVTAFEHMYQAADLGEMKAAQTETGGQDTIVSNGFELALKSLGGLDNSISIMGVDALKTAAETNTLTPGMMLDMAVKAQEFMFQSQLTATIANKSSDGISQLFRQQS